MARTKDFEPYESFVAEIRSMRGLPRSQSGSARVRAALDGAAASELRRAIPIDTRRAAGAFFTSHALAARLAESISTAAGPATILDPSCGAGDLLIAAARVLRRRRAPAKHSLLGVDLVSQFAALSRQRLGLLLDQTANAPRVRVRQGEGTTAKELRTATHVLMNPPYGQMVLPTATTWAGGSVNAAAPFFADCIDKMSSGAVVAAILPDVLRSGARYELWRELVETRVEIRAIELLGRFDTWTNVDVFLLSGVIRGSGAGEVSPVRWIPAVATETVGDRFDVSVGPVVHFRDPNRGNWHPYLTSQNFPTWETIGAIERNRRHTGRTVKAPFVVVPRTSSPAEATRSRAALVRDPRPVAVDNHLIVLRPLDGQVRTCKDLLAVLRDPLTSKWLNRRIGCRHLTVGAVREIPWRS